MSKIDYYHDVPDVLTAISFSAVGIFVGAQLGYADYTVPAILGAVAGFLIAYSDAPHGLPNKDLISIVDVAPILGGASIMYVFPVAGLGAPASALVGAVVGYAIKYGLGTEKGKYGPYSK